MALYACNLTGAAVTLAAGKRTVVLPAKVGALTYGAPVNVTSELEGLSGANYTALEAQRPATVAYVWDNGIPDYAVGTLTVTKTFASIDNATAVNQNATAVNQNATAVNQAARRPVRPRRARG